MKKRVLIIDDCRQCQLMSIEESDPKYSCDDDFSIPKDHICNYGGKRRVLSHGNATFDLERIPTDCPRVSKEMYPNNNTWIEEREI